MALSDFYKTGTTALYNSTTSFVSLVCSDTIENLYPNIDDAFDSSILINNGSTSVFLNNGSIDTNFTVYHTDASSTPMQNTKGTIAIKYLGSCITVGTAAPTCSYFCINKHVTNIKPTWYDNSWNSIKTQRFLLNVIPPHKSTWSNDFDAYAYENIPVTAYGLNSIYIDAYFKYLTDRDSFDYSAAQKQTNDYTTTETATVGDSKKQFYNTIYSVKVSDYRVTMPDETIISKTELVNCVLWFVFEIEGNVYFVMNPEAMPPRDQVRFEPKINIEDGTTVQQLKVTIGDSAFTTDTNYILPPDDETRGYSFISKAISGYFRQCSNYYVTNKCAAYTLNSCGFRWFSTSTSLTTAAVYRQNVNLGVMDADGIVNHMSWLTGEVAIQNSTNPNKDMNYNNIPERRDSDVDDSDKISSIDFGLYFQQTGLVKYYACTSQKLSDFSDALGDEQIIPPNKNVLPNLISLKAFPMAKSTITHGFEESVEIAGENTNVEMTRITNTMYNMRAGVVRINGKFGTAGNKHFLDFAPYTQVEIILPFIGPIQLDTNMVMYREIQIYYTIDIYVGTIKATIVADNNIVGTGVGNCSFDIPFTADNVGAKWADGLTAWQEVGLSAIYSGAAVVEGNYGGAIANYAKSIFSIQNASLAANKNYTQVVGHCTDTNNFTIHKPVVKISRPITDEIKGYKKEVGLMLQKYRKLGTLTGYTVCNNPILNVPNATSNEITMIKQKLIEGVII